MYSARSSGEAWTIMYTEMANSSIAPAGTPLVSLARHAFASSPAAPFRLVKPRLKRRRMRYFKLGGRIGRKKGHTKERYRANNQAARQLELTCILVRYNHSNTPGSLNLLLLLETLIPLSLSPKRKCSSKGVQG